MEAPPGRSASDAAIGGPINFESDNDNDLLGYAAMAGEDLENAREAYAVFYRRHYEWLFVTIRRRAHAWRLLGGEDGALDVVQETFARVFEKAATFDAGGVTDDIQLRHRARAWLSRIASSVAINMLRRSSNPPPGNLVYLEDVPGFEPEATGSEGETPRAKKLRAAIEQLPERDQDILWTWAQYLKPGEESQRLPDDVSQALAARWNTTPTAIRQRRKRALAKLERLLSEPES